jgi:hypothetical protein
LGEPCASGRFAMLPSFSIVVSSRTSPACILMSVGQLISQGIRAFCGKRRRDLIRMDRFRVRQERVSAVGRRARCTRLRESVRAASEKGTSTRCGVGSSSVQVYLRYVWRYWGAAEVYLRCVRRYFSGSRVSDGPKPPFYGGDTRDARELAPHTTQIDLRSRRLTPHISEILGF